MTRKIVIPSDLKAARKAEREVLDEVGRNGYSRSAVFAIRLAFEEALNNAIKHGNAGDCGKKVVVEYRVGKACVEIIVTDEGCGFNPGCVPDPRRDENLEKPSGRGIMLMKAYMDEVSFNQQGNEVRLVKKNAPWEGA